MLGCVLGRLGRPASVCSGCLLVLVTIRPSFHSEDDQLFPGVCDFDAKIGVTQANWMVSHPT